MPQFIIDYYNGIDFVNLTATLIIGAVLGKIATRYASWWGFWRETTREVYKMASKQQAEQDYRDILSYRLDPNYMTLYVARKAGVLLILCMILICSLFFIGILISDRVEHGGLTENLAQYPNSLFLVILSNVLFWFSAIVGALSELWKTSTSYRNFDQFKARVSEKLSNEEMAEIESSVKELNVQRMFPSTYKSAR